MADLQKAGARIRRLQSKLQNLGRKVRRVAEAADTFGFVKLYQKLDSIAQKLQFSIPRKLDKLREEDLGT